MLALMVGLDMMCDHYCINECSNSVCIFQIDSHIFRTFLKCYNLKFQKLIPSK